MKRTAITTEELEREYRRCIARERKRYREWAKTRQGAFETYQMLHFDAEAEEAREGPLLGQPEKTSNSFQGPMKSGVRCVSPRLFFRLLTLRNRKIPPLGEWRG